MLYFSSVIILLIFFFFRQALRKLDLISRKCLSLPQSAHATLSGSRPQEFKHLTFQQERKRQIEASVRLPLLETTRQLRQGARALSYLRTLYLPGTSVNPSPRPPPAVHTPLYPRPQELSNLAWSCARLYVKDAEFIADLQKQARL